MAGQDKILWSLSLEGADDVSKKLKSAGDVGEQAAKRLKQAFADVDKGSPSGVGSDQFKAGAEVGDRLREALHVLHPILEEAGLGLGNLGAFARLAGASIGGLAAAVLGSLLVGLAKIGEESEKAGLKLKALGVSGDTFEKLKQQAKELGVSTETLVPSLEKFAAAKSKINADQSSGLIRVRPNGATEADNAAAGVRVLGQGPKETGATVPDSVFLGAQKALIEGAQGEKISGDDAGKIADAFSTKLLENRKLTPEAVDQLNPANQNNLAKSLSSFFGTDLSSGAELKERLARPGQQAPSDREVFRALNEAEPAARQQAAAARGLAASFDGLASSARRLGEALAGKNLEKNLGGGIDKISGTLDKVTSSVERNRPLLTESTKQGYEIGREKAGLPGGIVGGFLGSDIGLARAAVGFAGDAIKGTIPSTSDFLSKALINPGAIQERQRPAAGPSAGSTVSPTTVPLQQLQQRELETQRFRDGLISSESGLPEQRGAPSGGPPKELLPGNLTDGLAGSIRGPALAEPSSSLTAPVGTPIPVTIVSPEPSSPVALPSGAAPAPLPVPTPPAAGPRADIKPVADAVAAGDQGIVSTLSSGFQAVVSAIGAAVQKPVEQPTGPVSGLGIRGATGGQITKAAEGGRLDVSPGGHLSGPGTGKSDSIDASVANGEFVINAEDTAKNLPLLHAINSGKDVGGDGKHYADGGKVKGVGSGTVLGPGQHQIAYDQNTGGATIDGVLHVPGDPILSDPVVAAAIARSKADANAQPQQQKHHSEFVGDYGEHKAGGGLVGSSTPLSRLREYVSSHFADGGIIDVPHLAIGGMPDISLGPSPDKLSFGPRSSGSGGADTPLHRVDLTTDHGTFRMMAPEETVKQLNIAAIDAKTFSTGKKPGWYGGQS